jgi:hypothetical protein
MNCQTNFLKTRLVFSHPDQSDSLSVVLNCQQTKTSQLHVWKKISNENPNQVYSDDDDGCMLSGSPTSTVWSQTNRIDYPSIIRCVSASKFPIGNQDLQSFHSNSLSMIIGFEDGTVGFIDRMGCNPVFAANTTLRDSIEPNSCATNDEQSDRKYGVKRRPIESHLRLVDQSLSGMIGIGITNTNHLVVFRQDLPKDLQSQAFNMSFFYEYLMLNGHDYWDLLVNTKQRLADACIEQLNEHYKLQTLSVQRAYYTKFYGLLYALYRQSTCASSLKSLDVLIKIVLNRCVQVIQNSIQSLNDSQGQRKYSISERYRYDVIDRNYR